MNILSIQFTVSYKNTASFLVTQKALQLPM